MKNLLFAAVTSMALLLGTAACAEEHQCPVVTGSDVSRHGNYHWMFNTYEYKDQKLAVIHTNMPWRMFQSDMFLSSFLGSAHMQIEANTGDTIVMSSIDGVATIAIWQPDNTGFSKGYISSYEVIEDITNGKLDGCFNKFVNLEKE